MGNIVLFFATPLLLGSITGFILSVIMTFIFIYRTIKEDQTLQKELQGYAEYSKITTKQLIPGIW